MGNVETQFQSNAPRMALRPGQSKPPCGAITKETSRRRSCKPAKIFSVSLHRVFFTGLLSSSSFLVCLFLRPSPYLPSPMINFVPFPSKIRYYIVTLSLRFFFLFVSFSSLSFRSALFLFSVFISFIPKLV